MDTRPRPSSSGFVAFLTAVLSVGCVFYFLFVYDISIPVETGDTVNLELAQNRELGVIVGLAGAYAFIPLALGRVATAWAFLKGVPQAFRSSPRKYAAWTMLIILALWAYFHVIPDVVFAPPKDSIDRAVNWRLGSFISGDGQLYESYKITHSRRFSSESGVWYVYDFSALCDVTGGEKTFSSRVALTEQNGLWQHHKGVEDISTNVP